MKLLDEETTIVEPLPADFTPCAVLMVDDDALLLEP
jgi:hypothetical protein